jgi:chromosome segregation protein
MKLAFVEVAGFRGFRERTRFDFDSGFAVLAGRNGVGKSTVFDAIDFALTGTINKYKVREAKGGGLEEHIWWVGDGAPEGQYVYVGFLDDKGEPFTVRRSRDRGLETREAEIGDRLCAGVTRPADWPQMLIHTSLIRDETIADLSLDLTEQARFSAVQAAMGGLRGPDHSERIEAILKAATLALKQQQERTNSSQADLGRALGSLTEAQSIASNSSDIIAADRLVQPILGRTVPVSPDGISELRGLIADRRRSIGPLLEAATQLESVRAQTAYFASPQGQEEIRSKQAEVDQAQSNRSAAARQLELMDSLYRAEREQDTRAFHLASLLEHGQAVGLVDGHCPLCDATRRQDQYAQALDALRVRLADRGERARHLSSDLSAAQAALDEADSKLRHIPRKALAASSPSSASSDKFRRAVHRRCLAVGL